MYRCINHRRFERAARAQPRAVHAGCLRNPHVRMSQVLPEKGITLDIGKYIIIDLGVAEVANSRSRSRASLAIRDRDLATFRISRVTNAVSRGRARRELSEILCFPRMANNRAAAVLSSVRECRRAIFGRE